MGALIESKKPISIVSPYGSSSREAPKRREAPPAPPADAEEGRKSLASPAPTPAPAYSSLFVNSAPQPAANHPEAGLSASATRPDLGPDLTAFRATASDPFVDTGSLDSFITTASIIGGMNPIWSFGGEGANVALSRSSVPNGIFGDESILSLSANRVVPHFASGTQQQQQQQQQQSLNSSINSSNKPIGFERHEKQIHSNNVNVGNAAPMPPHFNVAGLNANTGSFNMNMAIGLQLNNLNLDDFSCKSRS